MSTQRLRITGMTCDHCTRTVEDALNALPGVKARVPTPKRSPRSRRQRTSAPSNSCR
jgi:cation transport ATPase